MGEDQCHPVGRNGLGGFIRLTMNWTLMDGVGVRKRGEAYNCDRNRDRKGPMNGAQGSFRCEHISCSGRDDLCPKLSEWLTSNPYCLWKLNTWEPHIWWGRGACQEFPGTKLLSPPLF